MQRAKRVEKQCAQCANGFFVKPSDIRKGGGKYCSKACYVAARTVPTEGEKSCTRCGVSQSVEKFPRRTDRGPLARSSWCQKCLGIAGRPARERYKQTAKGIAAEERYQASEKSRASRTRNRKKRVASGKQAASYRRWREKNLEHARIAHRANEAVRRAVADGRLIKPGSCQRCGTSRQLHGHHHMGYEKEHMLTVLWLCIPCHERAHHG